MGLGLPVWRWTTRVSTGCVRIVAHTVKGKDNPQPWRGKLQSGQNWSLLKPGLSRHIDACRCPQPVSGGGGGRDALEGKGPSLLQVPHPESVHSSYHVYPKRIQRVGYETEATLSRCMPKNPTRTIWEPAVGVRLD